MHKSDAMVSVNDLNQAVEEKRRGYSEATMARLFKTEPYLATYLEGIAAHFGNSTQQKDYDPNGMGDALDKLIVIVRAMEIGQYRLWRDSIPANSPLARFMDSGPENGPKNDQNNK